MRGAVEGAAQVSSSPSRLDVICRIDIWFIRGKIEHASRYCKGRAILGSCRVLGIRVDSYLFSGNDDVDRIGGVNRRRVDVVRLGTLDRDFFFMTLFSCMFILGHVGDFFDHSLAGGEVGILRNRDS